MALVTVLRSLVVSLMSLTDPASCCRLAQPRYAAPTAARQGAFLREATIPATRSSSVSPLHPLTTCPCGSWLSAGNTNNQRRKPWRSDQLRRNPSPPEPRHRPPEWPSPPKRGRGCCQSEFTTTSGWAIGSPSVATPTPSDGTVASTHGTQQPTSGSSNSNGSPPDRRSNSSL